MPQHCYRPDDLATVAVYRLDERSDLRGPSQSVVQHRHLFLNHHRNALCRPYSQGQVNAEWFVGLLPDFLDSVPESVSSILLSGEDTEATGTGNGRDQLRRRQPVHSCQHDGVLDSE